MKAHISLISLSLTLLLSSCATATWTYDNVNYPTSAAATEAARNDVRQKVASVPRRDTPVAESVLIYTPSISWSRQAVLVTPPANEEQVRYVATVMYYGFYSMAEAVERRGIFQKTHLQEFSQRDPLANPNYEYIIWLRLDGPDSAKWMIAPGSDTSSASPLATSPISNPGDRMLQFVNDIERHVTTVAK